MEREDAVKQGLQKSKTLCFSTGAGVEYLGLGCFDFELEAYNNRVSIAQ
jgi:hypothetical protein